MSTKIFEGKNGEAMRHLLEEQCIQAGVSDLHLSPERSQVRVEWRLHGILQPLGILSPAQYEDLLRHIKFASGLKLNVTNVPQDGQYTIETSDQRSADSVQQSITANRSSLTAHRSLRRVNVRIATLPSRFGETVTLRFLDPQKGILPLSDLGFPEQIRATLEELVHRPNGLLLVTGPTGSGKTTTLYALLSTLIGKERNIITLEDPVEYELPGLVQSEIDTEHGYTFSAGLRSVLRHDPDVILVGEIRDGETAQTAVNAALTGHLVISTLHTNSAIEAIPRFLSMGVSPYTVAPALRGILAQRLVRTLTPACQTGTCDPAANDSYGGQMALPELLTVSPALSELILQNARTPELLAQAKKEGFRTMGEWGEEFVREKKTTREEVMRVTM